MLIDAFPFDVGDNEFFFVDASFGDDFAARRGDKTLSPKFNPITADGAFVADAICHRNKTTVRNRVTALNRFPRRMLRGAVLFLFAGMPADRRRIKQKSPRRAMRLSAPLPDTIGPSKCRRRYFLAKSASFESQDRPA